MNEVSVLHRHMHYMDMPGKPESGFHDQVLGLLGYIVPHQYPAVEVQGTTFYLVGAPVRVPTTAGMVVLLPTWDHPNAPLGPYTDEDPETEVVRPRHVQIIPGYYAALLMHWHGISAKMAYQEVHGVMQARGKLEMCQDILTWLKAACTTRGGLGHQHMVPSVFHNLTPVYFMSKVKGNLPALVPPTPQRPILRAHWQEERYVYSPGTAEQKTAESESPRRYKRYTRKPTKHHSFVSVMWDSLPKSQPSRAALQTAQRANCTRCSSKNSSESAGGVG